MMEHDQRVCPRCGEPAGDYRFCASCRAHIDSLTGLSSQAGTHSVEPIDPAAHVLRELLKLEQAMAVVSKGITERIAAAPVEVEATAEVVAGDASGRALERVTLATAADQRGGDVVQPPREVARLEDVLTFGSNDRDDRVVPAPVPAAGALPGTEPGRLGAPADLNRPAPVDPGRPAPVEPVSLPDGVDRPVEEVLEYPREVARLEDVLTVEPGHDHDQAGAPEPVEVAADAQPAVEPAQDEAPQEFWFEQSEALESDADSETAPAEPEAEAELEEPAPEVEEPVLHEPEPELPSADEVQPEAVAHVWTPPESTQSFEERSEPQASRRSWIVALCLLALVGLLALLIGRDARRLIGASRS